MPRAPRPRTQKDGRGLKFWRADRKRMIARSPWSGRRIPLGRGDAAAVVICCDCGLVHDFRWLVRKNYLRLTGWRDDATTAKIRAAEGIRLTRKRRR